MNPRKSFNDFNEDHELIPTSPSDLEINDVHDDERNSGHANSVHLLTGKQVYASRSLRPGPLSHLLPRPIRKWYLNRLRAVSPSRRRVKRRRSLLRLFILCSYALLAALVAVVLVGFTFFPSYTVLPQHYADLRDRIVLSNGRGGNVGNRKIFIAASLYDPGGRLAGGKWADNVLQLIDMLGPQNTYLSIYENDSGPEGRVALDQLRERVPCDNTLIFEEHLDPSDLPLVTTPDGKERLKRIEYLAAVRNRALEPLQTTQTTFDRVLFLNDVYFDPIDVLQLIFSTNGEDYRAACAVDFINPFKFYDTFATRDLGGFGMGIPFFPWFAYNGDSRSHQDVVQGKDAVRVRSCWGGMVSFDARFFQPQPDPIMVPPSAGSLSPSNITAPYQFRAEKDRYWEGSECCLIQADIQDPDPNHSGIYMNPFVRVAYDPWTLSWLWLTRRFESLYTPIHFLLDYMVGFPMANNRRGERPWDEVEENVWVVNASLPNGGSFQTLSRLASHSGFCGRRGLTAMKENFIDLPDGTQPYEGLPIPPAF
jgi:hypothetical protein